MVGLIHRVEMRLDIDTRFLNTILPIIISLYLSGRVTLGHSSIRVTGSITLISSNAILTVSKMWSDRVSVECLHRKLMSHVRIHLISIVGSNSLRWEIYNICHSLMN